MGAAAVTDLGFAGRMANHYQEMFIDDGCRGADPTRRRYQTAGPRSGATGRGRGRTTGSVKT